MLAEHITVIHSVELIAGKHDEVVVVPFKEGAEILSDRIGRSLIPS